MRKLSAERTNMSALSCKSFRRSQQKLNKPINKHKLSSQSATQGSNQTLCSLSSFRSCGTIFPRSMSQLKEFCGSSVCVLATYTGLINMFIVLTVEPWCLMCDKHVYCVDCGALVSDVTTSYVYTSTQVLHSLSLLFHVRSQLAQVLYFDAPPPPCVHSAHTSSLCCFSHVFTLSPCLFFAVTFKIYSLLCCSAPSIHVHSVLVHTCSLLCVLPYLLTLYSV